MCRSLVLFILAAAPAFTLPAPAEPGKAEEHITKARECERTWNFSCAREQYQKAVALEPESFDANYGLAVALFQNSGGGGKHAIGYFRKALALNPESADANFYTGFLTASEENKPAEALVLLEKARQLNPDHQLVYIHIGLAQKRLGRPDEAIRTWRIPIEKNRAAWAERDHIAQTLEEQGKLEEALKMYEDVMRLNPRNKVTPYNIGHVLFKLGRLDEALVPLTGELVMHQEEAEFLAAEIYRKKANEPEALKYYTSSCHGGHKPACMAGRVAPILPVNGVVKFADCEIPVPSGYTDLRLRRDRSGSIVLSYSRRQSLYAPGVAEVKRLRAFYAGKKVCGIQPGEPAGTISPDDTTASRISIEGKNESRRFSFSASWDPVTEHEGGFVYISAPK